MKKHKSKSRHSPKHGAKARPNQAGTNPAGATRDGVSNTRAQGLISLVGSLERIEKRRPILMLTMLSLILCCLIFPDTGWWPIAYVCLVPWLICVCTAARARFLYFASFLLGLGYFLINIRWMYPVTPPGYFALCAGNALSFPLAAWPIRHLYRRRKRSVALAAPFAWVAFEYLRSIGPTGFPWLLLGHSQYRVLAVIQISDLVGAYGVSFMLMMVNGWITDLLIQPIMIGRRDGTTRLPLGSVTTLTVVAGVLIYGGAQLSRDYLEEGPRIAMIQHDIPMYVNSRPGQQLDRHTVFEAHLELARRAAAEKPDLIVLPETIVSCYMNREFIEADRGALQEIVRRRWPGEDVRGLEIAQAFGRQVRDAFQRLSNETGIPIVVGASSIEWRPVDLPPRVAAFNSAFLIKPGEQQPAARYDKRHLVLFGEYVPFRYRYNSIYEWLNSLMPFSNKGGHYSLTPGGEYVVFEFEAGSDEEIQYRAAVPICYEEIIPYIARDFTLGERGETVQKNIDLLLSISNDGWFPYSAELEQHLAAAPFRAIEHRIAVARSVNTGASAMIYPNGKIHSRVTLTPEKIAKLKVLKNALEQLLALASKLDAESPNKKAYAVKRQELGQVLGSAVRPALAELGSEFNFVAQRLSDLKGNLSDRNPKLADEALKLLRKQIDDDLAMVERWQSRPWTAPGYLIDTAKLDRRITLYTRWGDWFAIATVGLVSLMLLDWVLLRIRRR